jgi:hypothetical protein
MQGQPIPSSLALTCAILAIRTYLCSYRMLRLFFVYGGQLIRWDGNSFLITRIGR